MKIAILIICFFASLHSYSQKKVVIDLSQSISKSEKTILLSNIASDIQYIPLETTSEALIGKNYNITYTGDAIIASSSESYSFYHFDKKGKYMNKIGEKGQGPGQYNMGLFYFLDFKKKLFYTHDWHTTFCYTYNGEFIRKINTPNLNMGVAEVLGEDMIIYSNDLYYGKNMEADQLFIIDLKGKPIHRFKGKIEEGKRYGINLTTRDYMYTYKGNTYFKPALENMIYKISSKKKEAVWEFKTGGKSIDVTRNETSPRDRMKSISIFQVKETDLYLFVFYGLEGKTFLGMYDKGQETFQNIKIVDDLSGGVDFVPLGKCPDEYLINAYFPSILKKNKINGRGKLAHRVNELKALVSEDNEEDNPILILVTLK